MNQIQSVQTVAQSAEWIREVLLLGAAQAAVVSVSQIRFAPEFRRLCEMNSCGNYDKSWMCPPCVGKVEALIAQARQYDQALVYQTVAPLTDSYDFEGMLDAGRRMNDLTQRIRNAMGEGFGADALHLGAGGCRLCARCARATGEPCRHPDRALPSLEAYGVNVSELAALAGMRYINGQNTVTYFGAVLFRS